MKECTKCLQIKGLSEFYKDGSSFRGSCKDCCLISKKAKYLVNSDVIKHKMKIYYVENKDIIQCRQKQYNLKNRIKRNNYSNKKRQEDVNFRLRIALRNRFNLAIKRCSKSGSAVRDLGCTIDHLKTHLESKFEPWMNWDNYGKYDSTRKTWNIDHIRPLSGFNLSNRKELLEACNWNNLQPMLAKLNLSKGAKWL